MNTSFKKGARYSYTNAGAAILASAVVVLASGNSGFIGVAITNIAASGGTGELAIGGTDERVTTFPKNTGEAFTDAQQLYWDSTNLRMTGAANLNNSNASTVLTETGTPTGGTFVLSANGQAGSAIAQAAVASAVVTGLPANIIPLISSVTGGAGGPWTINWISSVTTPPVITLSTNSLTGGTTPSVTVAPVAAVQNTKGARSYGTFASAATTCQGIINA